MSNTYIKQYEILPRQRLLEIRSSLMGQPSTKIIGQRIAAIDHVISNQGDIGADLSEAAKPAVKQLGRVITSEYMGGQEDLPDVRLARKYIGKLANARTRGIEFSLTISDMRRLLARKRCYFTGRLLTDHDPSAASYRTIDRLDAGKGYTQENSVACCDAANKLKAMVLEGNGAMSMTAKELKRFAKKC